MQFCYTIGWSLNKPCDSIPDLWMLKSIDLAFIAQFGTYWKVILPLKSKECHRSVIPVARQYHQPTNWNNTFTGTLNNHSLWKAHSLILSCMLETTHCSIWLEYLTLTKTALWSYKERITYCWWKANVTSLINKEGGGVERVICLHR